jgi:hypothetical protein
MRVNKYGTLALARWQRWMPTRIQTLPNPTAYFSQLGMQIQAEVTDLAWELAGPDLPAETYLEKAARLMTARRLAEEVVMANLVWTGDPELPLDQAREEWEQTRPSDENLISWAERIQDFPDSMPSSQEMDDLAQKWAVSVEFLERLVASEPPREYLLAHQAELNEATTIRFLRELR